jgi:hypothetical protein
MVTLSLDQFSADLSAPSCGGSPSVTSPPSLAGAGGAAWTAVSFGARSQPSPCHAVLARTQLGGPRVAPSAGTVTQAC